MPGENHSTLDFLQIHKKPNKFKISLSINMLHFVLFSTFAGISILSAMPTPDEDQIPRKIANCPIYSRPMLRPDGEPRKCLPHQLNLCINALEDSALVDTSGICCYHNQVDYFCCMDIPARLCPTYQNVTVVIHNNFPHSPFPVRSFHFRKGIEKEIVDDVLLPKGK